MASIEDLTLQTSGASLPIRIYRPSQAINPPLIVYFHGGGFVIGDLDTHDRNARGLAAATGATVASVAYRLAPEHQFPTPMTDGLDAICAPSARGADFGVKTSDLYLAGDSAGATIALVAAIALKGRKGAPIAGVIAAYPATDFFSIGENRSYITFGDGSYGLSTADVEWFRTHYAPNVGDRRDWRCSPAFAPDLRGVPPVLILGAYYDVLRDEAETFSDRLMGAGIPVAFRVVRGVNHGFMGAPTPPPQVSESLAVISAWFCAAD